MRNERDAFHIAVPVHNLDTARDFYVGGLGCKLARTYPDRITLDFFGDQLVCHLTEEMDPSPPSSLYPRHFGITFREAEEFDALVALCAHRRLLVFRDVATRFVGRAEEHRTVVLCDPSGNLIEFKHYRDPRMMY